MVSGCQYGPYQFTCIDSASCGPGGLCEPNYNLCSFANPGCPTGRAFGDLGGAYAGQCVGSQPPPDGGSPPDASQAHYGAAPFTVSFATAPTGTIDIDMPTTFNTDTGASSTGIKLICAMPTSGGDGDCVIAAGTIIISSSLRAVGRKPLVLVAADSISVPAPSMTGLVSIDVGSHRDQTLDNGAGSDPQEACPARNEPALGSGGAGGSFLGSGGPGGNGNGLMMSGGGMPGAPSGLPTALRGGCRGQPGPAFSGNDSDGGHGGGAVYLIAGSSITVGGTINAGGEGGGGGVKGNSEPAGGAGGGAGGMIGLDAPSIMGTGTLIANGGGGGGGNSSANVGGDGEDAVSTSPAAGGHGATGGTTGGNGGPGSAGAANGSGAHGANADSGGGGGGGGAGLILIRASMGANLDVSPMPTQ